MTTIEHPQHRDRLSAGAPAADGATDDALDHAARLDWTDEAGAQTAEYGIVTLAAVGFAGVLAVILAGTDVKGLLLDIVKGALSFG